MFYSTASFTKRLLVVIIYADVIPTFPIVIYVDILVLAFVVLFLIITSVFYLNISLPAVEKTYRNFFHIIMPTSRKVSMIN